MNIIRGIIQSAVASASKLMRITASGRAGETITSREAVQQYGLQSRPKSGSECVMLQHGDVILIVASDDRRYRLALNEGDAVLYSGTDNYVRCKGDGGIEVSSSGPVTVQAGDIRLGSETAAEVRALVDARFVDLFNTHVHASTGAPPTPVVAATCTTAAVKGK